MTSSSSELNYVSDTVDVVFDKIDTAPRQSVDTKQAVDVFLSAKVFFGQFRDSFGRKIFPTTGSRVRIIPLGQFYPEILTYVALPLSIDAPNNFSFTVYPLNRNNVIFSIGLLYYNARVPQPLPSFVITNTYMSNAVAIPFAFRDRQQISVQFKNVRICLSYTDPDSQQNIVTTPQLLVARAKNNPSSEFNCYINWYLQDVSPTQSFLTDTNDKSFTSPLNPGNVNITGTFTGSFQFYFQYREPANNYQAQPFSIKPAPQAINAPNTFLRNKTAGYNLLAGNFLQIY